MEQGEMRMYGFFFAKEVGMFFSFSIAGKILDMELYQIMVS